MTLDIFLVDDSAPVRERIASALAALAGVRVVGHAEGADEAIRGILELLPQVVLLDLKLAHRRRIVHQEDVQRLPRSVRADLEK